MPSPRSPRSRLVDRYPGGDGFSRGERSMRWTSFLSGAMAALVIGTADAQEAPSSAGGVPSYPRAADLSLEAESLPADLAADDIQAPRFPTAAPVPPQSV